MPVRALLGPFCGTAHCVLQDQVYSRPGGQASPSGRPPVLAGHFWESLLFQLSVGIATDRLGSLFTHMETPAFITPFPTSCFPAAP